MRGWWWRRRFNNRWRWRRISLRVTQRANAPLRAIAKFAVTLRGEIVLVPVDRIAADSAIPGAAIVGAQLIDALLSVVAVIAIREFADVALVFTHFVAAAGAIPRPVIAAAEVVEDATRIVCIR